MTARHTSMARSKAIRALWPQTRFMWMPENYPTRFRSRLLPEELRLDVRIGRVR